MTGNARLALYVAGVRVNIMIWDEIDSGDDFLAYTRVAKMLHGGGATEYFKDTQVSVKLMPRKSTAPQVEFFSPDTHAANCNKSMQSGDSHNNNDK